MKCFATLVSAAALVAVCGAVPDDCLAESTFLQLVHAQDISYSTIGDVTDLLPDIPQLRTDLEAMFGGFEVGVVSFSDKGILPAGDPNGDYCYREDVVLGAVADWQQTIDDLRHLSGRDWRESQYDALKYAVESETIGWSDPAGYIRMRMIILATDALPHGAGFFPELPGGPACEDNDYPSAAEVSALLDAHQVGLIILTPGDIKSAWEREVAGWPRTHVLESGGATIPADVIDAIEEILCEELPTEDPAASSPEPITPPPTEQPTTEFVSACGAALSAVAGSTTWSCADVCAQESLECDDPATRLVDTDEDACVAAVQEASPGSDFGDFSEGEYQGVAKGCGAFMFGPTTTPIINTPAGTEGCDAPAGTSPVAVRICCCGLIPV